ncbi:MAG TPA: hypothetical protein VFQ53_04800 [Kofleriaceae bacterium]|nr:hypothetical protein [Kofleriaceae bacterium]
MNTSALGLVFLVACGSGSSAPPTAPPTAADWSEAVAGLRVSLAVPATVSASTKEVEATITLRNDTDEPMRVLVVRPEIFRANISSLRVWQADHVVSLQPDPHPHGYLVTEDDFPQIAPHATYSYKQTLRIDGALATPGDYEVELLLENQNKRWPGGVQTLDGPTKPLFGGTDVPGMWVGKLTSQRRRFSVRA